MRFKKMEHATLVCAREGHSCDTSENDQLAIGHANGHGHEHRQAGTDIANAHDDPDRITAAGGCCGGPSNVAATTSCCADDGQVAQAGGVGHKEKQKGNEHGSGCCDGTASNSAIQKPAQTPCDGCCDKNKPECCDG